MGSALGKALSMTSSTSWSDIVNKIKGVTNQGAKTSSLNCGGSYTIPAGYHNGSGKITANSLSYQTSATATAGNILSGKTAYVNGSKITGTMANKGALNWSGSNTTYTVSAGYYSGGTLNSKTSYNNGYNAGYSAGNVSTSKVHAIEVTPGSSGERKAGSWSYTCPSNGIILGTCTRGNPWLSVNGSTKSGTSVTGGYQYIISVSKGNVVTPANNYTRPNIWFIGS